MKALSPTRKAADALKEEFERQVANLLQKGYPKAAGLAPDEFLPHLEPLRSKLDALGPCASDASAERIPFVIVISSALVPAEKALAFVQIKGKQAFTSMPREDIEGFAPIQDIGLPAGLAYLLVDVDTGKGDPECNAGPGGRDDHGSGALTADIRRRHRFANAPPRDPEEEQLLLHARLAAPRPPGHGTLAQRWQTQTRLVLGRQPAHLGWGRPPALAGWGRSIRGARTSRGRCKAGWPTRSPQPGRRPV